MHSTSSRLRRTNLLRRFTSRRHRRVRKLLAIRHQPPALQARRDAARVLHGFARRLQVQERLTAQVADCIWDHLQPKGVAVVIEASHACMSARGVNTPGVMMTTSRMMGTFREDERSRREVLALMGY